MSVSSDVPTMGWTRRSAGATVLGAMEDHLRQVGARIRSFRERKGLTQDGLGDLVGVTEKTISRWENGKHQAVLGNVRALADALDVSVQDITGQLPAPLGLGASEDQVELVADEFRNHVLEILTRQNRIEAQLDRQLEALADVLAVFGEPNEIERISAAGRELRALGQERARARSERPEGPGESDVRPASS